MSDYSVCFRLTEPQRYDKESSGPEDGPETRKRDQNQNLNLVSFTHTRTHAGMVGLTLGSVLMKFWRRQQGAL